MNSNFIKKDNINMQLLRKTVISVLIAIILMHSSSFAILKRTVGANGTYATVAEAVNDLVPLSENIELQVYVGEEGFTTPMTIEATSGFNGYTINIVGVKEEIARVTYYIDNEVEFQLDENLDNKTIEYLNGDGLLARHMSTSTGNEYYIKNHLGSTMAMVDNTGTVALEVYDYYPYGKKYREYIGGDNEETHTFTGKELDRFDEDLAINADGEGLYYFGARYYDPEIGKWTSIDPAREFSDLYRYTTNPIVFIDPDGLKEMELIENPKNFLEVLYNRRARQYNFELNVDFEMREARNIKLPPNPELARDEGFVLCPPDEAAFHQNGKGKPELKFIHKDGREVVYDGDTHKIITDPRIRGTFNFGPNPKSVKHYTHDIRLWVKYGNGPNDPTTQAERKALYKKARKEKIGF